jgi:hypothetical protein
VQDSDFCGLITLFLDGVHVCLWQSKDPEEQKSQMSHKHGGWPAVNLIVAVTANKQIVFMSHAQGAHQHDMKVSYMMYLSSFVLEIYVIDTGTTPLCHKLQVGNN